MTETEIERLVVKLTGDNAELIKTFTDSVSALQQSAAEMEQELNSIKDSLKETARESTQLGLVLMEAGSKMVSFGNQLSGTIGGIAKSGLMLAASAETNKIAFETMTGSVDQAEDILKRLTVFAAETPFEMPEIVQAARGLILFGERGAKLETTLTTLGNAASATGSSFRDVATIFNQVRGKGKLQMEEFYQFSERGILSMQDLADHYKVTTAEATQMISKGRVGFEDISAILTKLSGEGGRFENMMERQSKSLEGLMSTLSDSYNLLIRSIGETFLPLAKSTLAWAIEWLDYLREMPSDLKKITAVVIALVAGSGLLLTTLGGLLVTSGALIASYTALTAVLGGATVATLALNAASYALAMAPYVALAAAIAALGYMFYQQSSSIKEFNAAMKESEDLTKKISDMEIAKNSKVFEKGESLTGQAKEDFYTEELRKAENEVSGLSLQLGVAKKRAEELEPSFLSAWQAGKKNWEQQNQLVSDYQSGLANARTHVENLREKMKELEAAKVAPEGPDPKLIKDGDALRESLNMQIVTFGKTGREAKILELAYRGLPEPQLEMIRLWDAELTKLEETSRATKAAAEQKEKLATDITKFTESIKLQNETFGMSSNEVKLYEFAMRGATEEQLKMARAELDLNKSILDGDKAKKAATEELKKMTQEADQLKDRLATPFEKFSQRVANAQKLLSKGLIDQGQFQEEVKLAEKEILNKEFKANLKLTYTGVEGIEAGTADAIARIEEHRQRQQAAREIDKPGIAEKIFEGQKAVKDSNLNKTGDASTKDISDRLKQLVEIGEKQLKKNQGLQLEVAGL